MNLITWATYATLCSATNSFFLNTPSAHMATRLQEGLLCPKPSYYPWHCLASLQIKLHQHHLYFQPLKNPLIHCSCVQRTYQLHNSWKPALNHHGMSYASHILVNKFPGCHHCTNILSFQASGTNPLGGMLHLYVLPSYMIYQQLPISLIYPHQQLPTTQILVTCLYCCWGH